MTRSVKLITGLLAATAAVAIPTLVNSRQSKAEAATRVPAAALVLPASGAREVAVLAGGCFWGVEAVFEHVKGVAEVTSGFAGGKGAKADYASVSTGRTGKAEAVRIVYDPRQISYAELLRIFFAVAHDPTQVNRQGPDTGTQYRTAIFPQSPAQARVAQAYIAQLSRARVFNRPIATRIESGPFAPAETYHQDFMRKNPMHPYILAHDRPKLAELRRQFPGQWKG